MNPSPPPAVPRGILVVWVVVAVSLLTWPFSWPHFSSQAAGGAMLLPWVLNTRRWAAWWQDHKRAAVWLAWAPWALLVVALVTHAWVDGVSAGLPMFAFYMLKIPVLGLLAWVALDALQRAGLSPLRAQQAVWLAVLLPLLCVAAQLLLPSFHAWSVEVLGGFRAQDVIGRHAQGHPYRFLGPNGFLFASHGVAFACVALALLCLRALPLRPEGLRMTGRLAWGISGVELMCVALALLSARSALPLLALYAALRAFLAAATWPRRGLRLGGYIALLALVMASAWFTAGGQRWVRWLGEPLASSISHQRLASDSVRETLRTYRGVLPEGSPASDAASPLDAPRHWAHETRLWWGHGVYFHDNADYVQAGWVGSDSGLVRIVYVVGYVGLALFLLFWWAMAFQSWRSGRRADGLLQAFFWLFFVYSSVFFFKSEWLYQNFFLFYFFSLSVLLRQRAAGHDGPGSGAGVHP